MTLKVGRLNHMFDWYSAPEIMSTITHATLFPHGDDHVASYYTASFIISLSLSLSLSFSLHEHWWRFIPGDRRPSEWFHAPPDPRESSFLYIVPCRQPSPEYWPILLWPHNNVCCDKILDFRYFTCRFYNFPSVSFFISFSFNSLFFIKTHTYR